MAQRGMCAKQSNSMRKLFISDLDGTLLKIGNDYSAGISAANRSAIRTFVEQGNIFAIATARGVDYLDEVEPILGFRPDFIGQNGTTLAYGDEQSTTYIELALFDELCALCEEQELPVTICIHAKEGNYVLSRTHYPYGTKDALHDATFMDQHHQLLPKGMKISQLSGITLFCEGASLISIRDQIKAHFANRLEVVSSDIDLINVSPYGCTKGNGVKALLKHYQMAETQAAVIGDSDNDISMLQAVTNSYCMDHSEDRVKAAAAVVVGSVAEAIHHFCTKV